MKKTCCDGDSCTHTTDDPHYDGWHTLYNATSGYDLDLCPTCYPTSLIIDRGTGYIHLGDMNLPDAHDVTLEDFSGRYQVTITFTPSAVIVTDDADGGEDDEDDEDEWDEPIPEPTPTAASYLRYLARLEQDPTR